MKVKTKYQAIVLMLAGCLLMPFGVYSDVGLPDLSNAEVIVKSSVNTSYAGMTNTDSKGDFLLKDVPTGGINVLIRRNNKIIAQGAMIFKGGNLIGSDIASFLAPPATNALKSKPVK